MPSKPKPLPSGIRYIVVGGQDDGPSYLIPIGATFVPPWKIDDPRLDRLIRAAGALAALSTASKRDAASLAPAIRAVHAEIGKRLMAEPMPD